MYITDLNIGLTGSACTIVVLVNGFRVRVLSGCTVRLGFWAVLKCFGLSIDLCGLSVQR